MQKVLQGLFWVQKKVPILFKQYHNTFGCGTEQGTFSYYVITKWPKFGISLHLSLHLFKFGNHSPFCKHKKLYIKTPFFVILQFNIMGTPPPVLLGGWASNQIFKRGGLPGPQLLEGVCWKRGVEKSPPQGGCNFCIKIN